MKSEKQEKGQAETNEQADTSQQGSIVVGGVPEHFNLPWHQAIDQDAFAEIGVDVVFKTFHGGTGAMTKALRKREIDIALLLTEGCVADLLNGNPSKIVKTYIQSPLIWGIHVGAKNSIESIDQMKGKRYAISRFGSGSHLMAIVDAAERGWATGELDFVKIGNLTGARKALTHDEADIFFWEKYTTAPYVQSGEFRRIGIRETLWPAFVACATDSCLQTKQIQLRQVLDVINRFSANLMNAPNAVELIAKRYQLPNDQVAEWFELTQWNTDFLAPLNSLRSARDYLEKLKLVPDNDRPTSDLWFQL